MGVTFIDERKPWPAYSVKRIREGNSLDSNSYNTGCKMFFLLTGHAYANEGRKKILFLLPFLSENLEGKKVSSLWNIIDKNRIESNAVRSQRKKRTGEGDAQVCRGEEFTQTETRGAEW